MFNVNKSSVMKKIMVPTDFTANANKAVDFAVAVAKEAKAEVLIIHVCDLVDTTFKDHLAVKKEHNQLIVDRANQNLSLLKKNIEDTQQVNIHTGLYNGPVVESILQAVEDNQVDFIIISTRGETPFSESIFGSTASGIIGKANVAVMIISPLTQCDISSIHTGFADGSDSGKFKPDSILLATNHFEENCDLLNPVVDVARLFSATIYVVVFVDKDVAERIDYVYNIKELNHYLKFLKNAFPDVAFKGELLEGEKFEETIKQYNEKNGIDIIAMVTYPKTFWESLLKKRITKEMAFHSTVPVIAITGK
jgi:nucleotide-binding universal stress UspA family protein